MATEVPERAERFARDIAQLRIEDPSPGRHSLWLRVGVVVMLAGVVVTIVAAFRSADTIDAARQRDALALGTVGIATTILGAAIYLRYAVTKVLRFWLARLSFELRERSDGREVTP